MSARAADALAALRSQGEKLAGWFVGLEEGDFARPTVLPGWDVRTLLGHQVLVFEGCSRALRTPSTEQAVPAADYVRRYRRDVEAIAAATAATAGEHWVPELIHALYSAVQALPEDADEARTIMGGRGPVSTLDWIRTRIVDVVVHCDDLGRSLPDSDQVPIERAALAAATRSLAEILAGQSPGHAVELRIPPFVAVQVLAGPRHTRGTPSNVVETDPTTWLRLSTGRASFADLVATGAVHARGSRADLTAYLPVLS